MYRLVYGGGRYEFYVQVVKTIFSRTSTLSFDDDDDEGLMMIMMMIMMRVR